MAAKKTTAKAAAPAPAKAKRAKQTAAPADDIREVPFDSLFVAPENARYGKPVEDLEEITATIERHGLLQPLVVYEADAVTGPDPVFAVTNGRRRLAGIAAVRERDPSRFTVVRVRVAPREHAAEIALAGEMHVELSAADQARAWARMQLAGEETATIAKAFGVTERVVEQRIRLGGLHEPILIALDAGEISLEIAQLYAGALMSRQESTWKALGPRGSAWRVKEELAKDTVRAGDALALFVGEAAYSEAGGQIEQDFFAPPEDSRWLNVEIAERLAEARLQSEAARIATEEPGWQFIETRREYAAGEFVDGNLGKERKPNAEEKKRRTRIEQRLTEIGKRQLAIDNAESTDEDFDWQAADTEREALDDEARGLEIERETLETSLRVYDDATRAKGGVIVSIGNGGAIAIRRGMVKPKPGKAAKPKPSTGGKGAAAAADPATPEPAGDMTHAAHERCTRLAGLIIGDAMQRTPELAIAVLAAQLARILFSDDRMNDEDHGRDGGGDLLLLQRRHQSTAHDLPALAFAEETERDRTHWRLSLRQHWKRPEQEIASWALADQMRLLAFCTAQLFTVLETSPNHADDATRSRAAAIGALAKADAGAVFTPPLEFLKGLSRTGLEAAAGELRIDIGQTTSKAAIAAQVADAAAPAQWTPPLVRQLTGSEWTDQRPDLFNADAPPAKAKAKPPARGARTAPKKKAAAKVKAKPPAKPPAKKAKKLTKKAAKAAAKTVSTSKAKAKA